MISFTETALVIGAVSIRWYALCIVTGLLLAYALASVRETRLGLPKEVTADLMLWCVPAALIGARAYYVLFSLDEYLGGPWWKVFAVWEGGLAIYGGIIGGLGMGALFAKRRKLSFAALADLSAPCFPLGQACGRWGNFINRECYGGLVTSARLRFFPAAVNIGGEWHYATFFYESAWCLLIMGAILVMEKRKVFRRRGDAFLTYVFLYAAERAAVEGLRADSLYIGPLRVSQALSLLAAAAVCVYLFFQDKKRPAWLVCALPFAAACFCPVSGVFICCGIGVISYFTFYMRKREIL